MARRMYLQPHRTSTELGHRYRQAHDPIERSQWHMLWLLDKGHTAVAVGEMTGYSAYWMGQIAKRYNTTGPTGIGNRRRTSPRTAPTLLSVPL